MYSKKILANGIRLITIPRKESLSVNILVLVEAGSKYETASENGISHFLEHMCFKGTEKRPTALSITSELDSIGAEYNAFTSQEYTGYYVTCLPDKVGQALDIISDMYLNPVFNEKEIEKEKGVIQEEINLDEDTPTRHIGRVFNELMYGNTPAGRSVLGTKETVRQISRSDFKRYRDGHYLSNSTVVVVAGKFNESKLTKMVGNAFAGIGRGKRKNKEKVVERQIRPAVKIKYKKLDQTHLLLGFRTFGVANKDVYAAEVLSGILGEGMSSRLFQKIREEKGLAYYVHSYHRPFTDHGYLAVVAGVKNDSLGEAVETILAECLDIINNDVAQAEIDRVKDSIIGTTFLSLEAPADVGSYYGLQELLKQKMISPEEFAAKIKAVTIHDVRRLAKRIFTARGLNLAILGPHEKKEKFEHLLSLWQK